MISPRLLNGRTYYLSPRDWWVELDLWHCISNLAPRFGVGLVKQPLIGLGYGYCKACGSCLLHWEYAKGKGNPSLLSLGSALMCKLRVNRVYSFAGAFCVPYYSIQYSLQSIHQLNLCHGLAFFSVRKVRLTRLHPSGFPIFRPLTISCCQVFLASPVSTAKLRLGR